VVVVGSVVVVVVEGGGTMIGAEATVAVEVSVAVLPSELETSMLAV
jgi:hypothetical protein